MGESWEGSMGKGRIVGIVSCSLSACPVLMSKHAS
jgi:hypothetical protein